MIIEFGNTRLQLLPEKGIFLPEEKLLVIGDLHFGKTTEFREAGFAIPASLREENAKKLIEIIRKYAPQKVLFLGDLFHGKFNEEFEYVGALTTYFSRIGFVLTTGNHEKLSAEVYRQLDLEVVPHYDCGAIRFQHEPEDNSTFVVSGHLHPAVRLEGMGRQRLNVPVFAFRKNQLILPAFGRFTGNYYLEAKEWDHLYAVGNERVYRLK